MTNPDLLHNIDEMLMYLRKLQERPDLLTPTERMELDRLKQVIEEALKENDPPEK
jgi:hypothetical protein